MFKKQAKKTRVLFVDSNNDLTSQVAEYFTNRMFGDAYEVYSAGPTHDFVDCDLISVMFQEGYDMRRQMSKDFKDQDILPADAEFDFVIYLVRSVFDEWSGKTPWKGRQILCEMRTVSDFDATDDAELAECYSGLIREVREWVASVMDDPSKLEQMVTA